MNLRPRYPIQFLVALISAFLLWYVLAAQRSENISVRGVKARLTLVNIPRDLVLTSSVPDTVSLQLRGPLTRTLDSSNPPEVLLDLSDARPGLNSYPINESDIPLPTEVDVVSVDPPAITLELERQNSRLVPVRAVIGCPRARVRAWRGAGRTHPLYCPGPGKPSAGARIRQHQTDFGGGRRRPGGGHRPTAPPRPPAACARSRGNSDHHRHQPGAAAGGGRSCQRLAVSCWPLISNQKWCRLSAEALRIRGHFDGQT